MTDTQKGIGLMVITTIIFAAQDGISRHLAGEYNVLMVVMIRYWFFAAFVISIAKRQAGSIRAAAATQQPVLQTVRGFLLAAEICVMITAFTLLGLVESHVIFTAYPLLVAALSGPVLGEAVGWRRWAAIGIGFVGVVIILQPGVKVFSPLALIPLLAALMFALYNLLTRLAARKDSAATSFFWTGTVGAVFTTTVEFPMADSVVVDDSEDLIIIDAPEGSDDAFAPARRIRPVGTTKLAGNIGPAPKAKPKRKITISDEAYVMTDSTLTISTTQPAPRAILGKDAVRMTEVSA